MPIVDLPRRDLGRTGLQVTRLGYGAMELRGAPGGRDVTEAQADQGGRSLGINRHGVSARTSQRSPLNTSRRLCTRCGAASVIRVK
jgi:hypothetical protein